MLCRRKFGNDVCRRDRDIHRPCRTTAGIIRFDGLGIYRFTLYTCVLRRIVSVPCTVESASDHGCAVARCAPYGRDPPADGMDDAEPEKRFIRRSTRPRVFCRAHPQRGIYAARSRTSLHLIVRADVIRHDDVRAAIDTAQQIDNAGVYRLRNLRVVPLASFFRGERLDEDLLLYEIIRGHDIVEYPYHT